MKHDYGLDRMLESIGYLNCIPEFKFHPTRKWRSDYAFPIHRLLIEIEGGTWISGRHNHPGSILKDFEKYNEAAIEGYQILRFTPQQVRNGEAVDTIKRWFDAQL